MHRFVGFNKIFIFVSVLETHFYHRTMQHEDIMLNKDIPRKLGIYKLTNMINNKIYIGKSNNLYKRISNYKYASHNQVICYAIKKYGWENFDVEILQDYDNTDNNTLLALETAFIDYFNSTDKNIGYNICLFSNDRTGIKVSKETKLKLSQINIGKYLGNKSGTFGRKHTEEEKQKMKIARAKQDRTSTKKSIRQIDLKTNQLIKIWDCASNASKFLIGRPTAHITDNCRGRIKSAYGFKWEYS